MRAFSLPACSRCIRAVDIPRSHSLISVTSFFIFLYFKLLFVFTPILLGSFLPNRIFPLGTEEPPLAEGLIAFHPYFHGCVVHHAFSRSACRGMSDGMADEDNQLLLVRFLEPDVVLIRHLCILERIDDDEVRTAPFLDSFGQVRHSLAVQQDKVLCDGLHPGTQDGILHTSAVTFFEAVVCHFSEPA